MHSIVGWALGCVASIACAIPMATISSKWLQSRTTAYTSQPLFPVLRSFSALCCHSCSTLLWSLSCRTASAQVLGVFAMMHTTARADRKSCRQRRHKFSSATYKRWQQWISNLEPGNVERTIYVYRWDHRSTHVCGACSAGLPRL